MSPKLTARTAALLTVPPLLKALMKMFAMAMQIPPLIK